MKKASAGTSSPIPTIISIHFASKPMKPTIEQETARAEQLALNCRWLIDKMDRIHTALCPEKCGSWVKRAEQAVAAAEAIAKNKTAP